MVEVCGIACCEKDTFSNGETTDSIQEATTDAIASAAPFWT